MQEEVKTAREALGAISDLVKVAADDPHAKEAARNLGQAAVTIARTINTALLPLAAVNFAFEKARKYFSGEFQRDLVDRTKDIPLESICDPRPVIAGPALQGLAFTHEEPPLKIMYLNLLATAMDARRASSAHPAFVEMIKQLDGPEAILLSGVLKYQGAIPIIQIRSSSPLETGWILRRNHILDLADDATQQPIVEPRIGEMVDNWIRLGLVEVRYDLWLTRANAYSWVSGRPEFQQCKTELEDAEVNLFHQQGFIKRTDLGIAFAKAVSIDNVQQASINKPIPTS